jgi:hypothetical protein
MLVIDGIVFLLIGLALGRYMRRQRQPKLPKPIQPICGCKHHLSMHDKTGRCHGSVERPSRYDYAGDVTAYKFVSCACQQYIGPQPMMELIAPDELFYHDNVVRQVVQPQPVAEPQPPKLTKE